ncbi:unnamed protein product [Arabidopsis arenosa]|uniref:Uncharacterized protein n=1 Tax=Arabidopsis arenosa TaxID=38785 RepID=A0A8S1ZMM0_ARAAE|nr:unnamed protein product [Arabidopsis arenosa]
MVDTYRSPSLMQLQLRYNGVQELHDQKLGDSADCAVVVKELWWKTPEGDALDLSFVSFVLKKRT